MRNQCAGKGLLKVIDDVTGNRAKYAEQATPDAAWISQIEQLRDDNMFDFHMCQALEDVKRAAINEDREMFTWAVPQTMEEFQFRVPDTPVESVPCTENGREY